MRFESLLEPLAEPCEPFSDSFTAGCCISARRGLMLPLPRSLFLCVEANESAPRVSISPPRDTPFSMVPATNSAWWTRMYRGQLSFQERRSMSCGVASSRPGTCFIATAKPKIRVPETRWRLTFPSQTSSFSRQRLPPPRLQRLSKYARHSRTAVASLVTTPNSGLWHRPASVRFAGHDRPAVAEQIELGVEVAYAPDRRAGT